MRSPAFTHDASYTAINMRLLLLLSIVLPLLVVVLSYFSLSTELHSYMPTYLQAATRLLSLSSSVSSLPGSALHRRIVTANMSTSTSSSSLTSSIRNTILATFAADSLSLGGQHPTNPQPL